MQIMLLEVESHLVVFVVFPDAIFHIQNNESHYGESEMNYFG